MDTSSISFTAHYTGQVWAKNGLSNPQWQTPTGRLLYHALSPFEWVGKRIVGGNIRTFLLQRHLIIDHLLHQALERHPELQVVEIACGLSPHGTRFCQQYPQLLYLEADLPAMAARKNKLLKKVGAYSQRHMALPLDFFRQNELGLKALFAKHLNTAAPVLVITEGLINYFELATLAPVWRELSQLLKQFPQGYYLTDNYPLLDNDPNKALMETLSGLLGWVSRSNVNFHFNSLDAIAPHYQELGFSQVRVHNPEDYYARLSLPENRGNPLVHVLEMQV